VALLTDRTTVKDTMMLDLDAATEAGKAGERVTIPAHTTTADGTYYFLLTPHILSKD